MRPRFLHTLIRLGFCGGLSLVASLHARAENVASITSVVITQIPLIGGPPPPPPLPLDLDPNDAAPGGTHFSIPRGATIIITVKGVAAGPGGVFMELMDDDSREFMRGGPDLISSDGAMPGPDGTFTLNMACSCPVGYSFVSNGAGEWDSGEQSAELFLRDGNLRSPADKTLPGDKKKPSYWRIDCDKDSTHAFSTQGEEFKTIWGDSLTVRPGALTEPRTIRIANMYPLRDTESVPPEYGPISEAITLEPSGLPLLVPARLTFLYTREEAGEIADESQLAVFRYDSLAAAWYPHPGATVNVEENLLSVDIDELGTYGFAPARVDLIKSWQVTHTDFGDNTLEGFESANGSELVAAGAVRVEDSLRVFIAGNLESNFNKLELFIDTGPGGQNRLRGDNAPVDFGGLNRMGDDGSGNGLQFDAGFQPDYWIGITTGNPGTGIRVFANFATLATGGGGDGYFLGSNVPAHNGILYGGFNPHGIRIALDNSNVHGVQSGCGQVPQQDTVWTGVDLMIPLQAMGGNTSCVRICAFINGESHDFVSNQVLGPLPTGTCSLGEPRAVNFQNHAGAQYFELCPQGVGVEDGPCAQGGSRVPEPVSRPHRVAVGDRLGRTRGDRRLRRARTADP